MKEFVEKLISRFQEVTYDMEICEEQFDMNNPYFMDVDYKMVKFDDAKTIIKELAEEYDKDINAPSNDGWIPCSERLPSIGVSALCYWKKYNKYDNTTSYYYSLMHRNEDNQWLGDLGMCNGEVLAWMPLPQPYKKGSADNA